MPTVLITGANRGIGRALAEAYAGLGYTVVAGMRRVDGDGPMHAKIERLAIDVSQTTSLDAAARQLSDRAIDLLICNAGQNGARGGVEAGENTNQLWADLFATNVAGVFFTARAFLPQVAVAKGKIAILSSRMGSSAAAVGMSYAYRASKAAASNIAANLAAELKPKGIAVASYHPGWVKTDMGGAGADIDVATSVQGLMARFDALSLATTGSFLNYDGSTISY